MFFTFIHRAAHTVIGTAWWQLDPVTIFSRPW